MHFPEQNSLLLLIMSTEKPTILLIPGAWHKADIYEVVAHILRIKGYPVVTLKLLSAGGPLSTTVADDAEHIRQAYLNDLVAQGKEVVVIMHSYAGIPGTESIKGLARKDLAAQGKQGGIVALIYIAAFLIAAGQSAQSTVPEGLEPAMTMDVRLMHDVALIFLGYVRATIAELMYWIYRVT